MKYPTSLIAASLLLMAATANAGEFSSTVTAVSDYDFRGVTLSAKDPALQASIDWAHDSGFYAGAWASNIDYDIYGDGNIELDLYLGFGGETSGGLGWDTGIVFYTYPGSSSSVSGEDVIPKIPNYPEIWASISHGPVTFKQWYTNDWSGTDLDALYSEINASFELPAGFALNLHTGYNYGNAFAKDYLDYSIGVGYTAGHFDMNLKYGGTDTSGIYKTTDDTFNNEPRLMFSISTTFPWGAGE